MIRTADIVIIGGGVNGVGTAYYLARRGMKRIVLLEKNYLGHGATGRCGGGIRQQWGLDQNIILVRDSVRMFKNLSAELGFNIFFRQGGYLMLISDDQEYKLISTTIPRQNELGVPTELLEPGEIAGLVPGLNLDSVIAGAFCATDGTAYPYAVLWGYAGAARRLGVDIRLATTVQHISSAGGRFEITTTDGTWHTPRVLNVAGAATRHIAIWLGVDIPTRPFRHEIAVTEPLKPCLDPMVISIKEGYYFSQSLRGEIVGGIGDPGEPPSDSVLASPDFLLRYARALRQAMPALGRARIIRQWAGSYDVSPDDMPILGGVAGLDGYYHACGFSGHGFMISPVVSSLMSELITTGTTSGRLDKLGLDRFDGPAPPRDPYVVG
jgi:sarcosine oxidase subunit beta